MALDRTNGSTSPEPVRGWRLWARWALLLAWMALIFQLSATPDLKTVPLVQRLGLLPGVLAPELINLLEFVLRKAAHMAAFAVLATLAYRALAGTWPSLSRGRLLAASLLVAMLYAASDEWHQTFVPTRDGTVKDVAIDTAGATLALLVISYLNRRRSLPPQRQI